jgi:hypothetical protein
LWRIFYVIIYLQTEMSDAGQVLCADCEAMCPGAGQSPTVQNQHLVMRAKGRSLPAEIREVLA